MISTLRSSMKKNFTKWAAVSIVKNRSSPISWVGMKIPVRQEHNFVSTANWTFPTETIQHIWKIAKQEQSSAKSAESPLRTKISSFTQFLAKVLWRNRNRKKSKIYPVMAVTTNTSETSKELSNPNPNTTSQSFKRPKGKAQEERDNSKRSKNLPPLFITIATLNLKQEIWSEISVFKETIRKK